MEELKDSKYIAWTYSDYGWHPNGFDSLKEAIAHESYGSEKIITRGLVDWQAVELCPHADCPKVKYKDCPVHGEKSVT